MQVELYQPHPNQYQIIRNKARFKVVVCGRRFGKTTLAINELIYAALFKEGGQYWYIAPTYRQAKEIAWRMLVKQYFALPIGLQKGKNEQELWVEIGSGSRVSLKGAENEDSLRGSGLDGMVIDEVASIRNWDYLWSEALSPSLLDKKGWAWFIGTPKGFNHFYDLYTRKDPEYASFHFTSYDNPYIEKEELDKERDRKTDDSFAQEYLADFRKHTGLIYKEFSRDIHVIEPFDLPDHWQFYRGMDFGANHPTACLWFAVAPNGIVYQYDEYVKREQKTKYHAEMILAKTKQPVLMTYRDPSGEQAQLDYAEYGLYLTPATKIYAQDQGWVRSGILKIQQALKLDPQTRRAGFYIFSNCVNTIKEYETYHWMEVQNEMGTKDFPEKINDDCMDATRYFFVSYEPIQNDTPDLDIPVNQFTGY